MSNEELDVLVDASTPQELANVNDVDQFYNLLNTWHQAKVAELNHMRAVPEGTKVSVEGKPTVWLSGEAMQAFQYGIDVSLSLLGTLPFEAITEPVNEQST